MNGNFKEKRQEILRKREEELNNDVWQAVINPRNKQPIDKKKRRLIILIVIIGILAVIYLAGVKTFSKRYLPNTHVGIVDISMCEPDVAIQIMERRIDEYELAATREENHIWRFRHDVINPQVDGEEVKQKLEENRRNWRWPIVLIRKKDCGIENLPIIYDTAAVEAKLTDSFDVFESDKTAPVDAKVEYESDIKKFHIVKETKGDKLDHDKTLAVIDKAITSLHDEVDLNTDECLMVPKYTKDMPEVINANDEANKYLKAKINYEVEGADDFTLDWRDTNEWISVNNDMAVVLDEKKMSEFIEDEIADEYDTYSDEHKFKTHDGDKVTIEGDYGWSVSIEGEKAALIANIKDGKEVTREPVWGEHKAISHDPDWGDTYIEVDLGTQRLWYVVDGETKMSMDIVSGDESTDNDTEEGLFFVGNKISNPNAGSASAMYMLTFLGDIGIYDTPWTTEFGGWIYQDEGTADGGISISRSDMKSLYELVNKGCPVIIYKSYNPKPRHSSYEYEYEEEDTDDYEYTPEESNQEEITTDDGSSSSSSTDTSESTQNNSGVKTDPGSSDQTSDTSSTSSSDTSSEPSSASESDVTEITQN